MEILVNGQPLEFSLSGEKNIYEVTSEVLKWANKDGYAVVSVEVDGEVFAPEDEALKDLSVDAVERVDYRVEPFFSVVFEVLSSAYTYLVRTSNLPPEVIEGKIDDFAGALQWLDEAFSKVVQVLGIDESSGDWKETYDRFKNFKARVEGGDYSVLVQWRELANELSEFVSRFLLHDIVKIMTEEQKRDVKKSLVSWLEENIDEYSSLLRSGESVDLTLLSLILYMLGSLETEESALEDLKSIAEELVDAMAHSDNIMIADILEYRLKEFLETL